MVETSDEWIVTRTGIRERHIAAPNETVATMGFAAANRAIEMAGIDKEQIGLIVVATTSSTHAFPRGMPDPKYAGDQRLSGV